MSVISPVRTQTPSSQPDEPTSRAISAETMKMPEPIMAPATSMVASNSPSRFWKPASTSAAGVRAVMLMGGSGLGVGRGVGLDVHRGYPRRRSERLQPARTQGPADQQLLTQRAVETPVAEVDHQAECKPGEEAPPVGRGE